MGAARKLTSYDHGRDKSIGIIRGRRIRRRSKGSMDLGERNRITD